jgi:hypothetical protein
MLLQQAMILNWFAAVELPGAPDPTSGTWVFLGME